MTDQSENVALSEDEGEEQSLEDEEEEEEEGDYGLQEQQQGEEQEQEEEVIPFVSIFEILDAPRVLPEPIDLTLDHVRQIQSELGIITLCWPDIENPLFENRVNFPENYVKNTDKEKLLLLYAENFRRQFVRKFPNRKPLLLACPNEVRLTKMVCTTLRPTKLSHPQIETWEKCSSFLGDQLKYEPLQTPTLLPTRLYSPHTVIIRQSGHSFELANALCSLLIGLGYNAFVVSGYATQDVCLKILMRVDSPFPPEPDEEIAAEKALAESKYALKPPKDLRSKFLLAMAQREIDRIEDEKRIVEEERQRRLRELETPPYDELYGQRLHAWVLLMAGTKGVEQSIFIEASTGNWHPLSCKLYLGIESLWNNINYWVNLQDCSRGTLEELDYDLSNLENWEHFLIGEPSEWRDRIVTEEMEEDDVELMKIVEEKHLDMPSPWSLPIYISHEALSYRFPNGVKKTWFKRTVVEQYAPHVQQDGLVSKICRYNDLECSPTELHTIDERYKNRNDMLVKVISDCLTGIITEYYKRGREDAVKRHIYRTGYNSSVESERTILFYTDARHDSLRKLELDALYVNQYFVQPENRIYYRHVDFAPRGKPPPGMLEGARRVVMKVIEKFDRDESKPASQDVNVREFCLVEREIHLKYHYEEGKVTASTRDFSKPPIAEMGDKLRFNPHLTIGYQSEVGAKPPRQMQLFQLFEEQLREEERSLYRIRDIEDQVLEFLKLRYIEVTYPKLSIFLFDRVHNTKHAAGMREKEQQEKEHREREVEDEIDYLAPYINRLGGPKRLNRMQAGIVVEWCLNEFKTMLVERANSLQKHFENETTKMTDKQNWYLSVQDTLEIDEETEYFEEMKGIQFYLHTLELRLARHRDLSPYRYEALETYLKMDPRLSSYFK